MSLWEEAPVSLSASPEEERRWTASLVSCSSTSGLWQRFAQSGFSGRTCQEFLTLEMMRSPNFSGKFKTSGISVSRGEFLTLNSSEWPSDADVSFLSDTLEVGGGAAAVLFESESVCGNTQTSRQKREELARAAGRGAKAGGSESLNGWDVQSKRVFDEDGIAPTLNSGCREGGGIQPSVLQAVALQTGHTAGNGGGFNTDDVSYTLSLANDHAVAFAQNNRNEVRLQSGDGSITGPVAANDSAKGQGVPFVAQPMTGGADDAMHGERSGQLRNHERRHEPDHHMPT